MDWKELLEGLRKLTKKGPENIDAWNNLGNAYANLTRHDDAIAAFREVIRLDPEDADAWVGLGLT